MAALLCGLTALTWLGAEHFDKAGHFVGGEQGRYTPLLFLFAFLLGAGCIYLLVEALNARASAEQQDEPGETSN